MPDYSLTKALATKSVRQLPLSERLAVANTIVLDIAFDIGLDERSFKSLSPTIERLAEKVSEMMRTEEASTVGHGLLLISLQLWVLREEMRDVECEEAGR